MVNHPEWGECQNWNLIFVRARLSASYMFRESVDARSENVRRMLRMPCLKIIEGVCILVGIVTPVSLRWCHSSAQASA